LEFRSYIIRRLLLLIPVLFGVTLFIFGITMLFTPLQRASLYVTNARQMSSLPEIIATYGLDRPFFVQYGTWINQVFHGNLGWSRVVGLPVWDAIWSFLPATVELAIFATPLIILIGIFFGTTAAAHKDRYSG
jgi:ABC-type dipeptide/oligopeptide/nickel transport system permease component